jgi:hypothetical protein
MRLLNPPDFYPGGFCFCRPSRHDVRADTQVIFCTEFNRTVNKEQAVIREFVFKSILEREIAEALKRIPGSSSRF